MSKTILSAVILILAQILPLIGVDLGSEELTSTAQTLVTLFSGIVIWIERTRKGDVSPLGFRK